MNITGFDLGSSSLKVIESATGGKRPKIISAYEFAHPFGTMLPPDQDQMNNLADMIKKALVEKKMSLQHVRAALPESLISTKIVTTPTLTDAELASAIDWLAEQNIAIPLDELRVEYQVLYRPDGGKRDQNMRVALFGVPKVVIENYMRLFEMMDIQPEILETQVVSIMRTFVQSDTPTTLVVHMGASATDFFIVHNGELVFVYSFPNGGRLLTRSIERGLNVDTAQAQEYKHSYGIDKQFLEGKIETILSPVMQLFVNEIYKAMQFFSVQYGTEHIKRVLLTGGSAQLPGMIEYLASTLQVEVITAHPFSNFEVDTKVALPTDHESSFDVASGLALL